MSQSTEKRMFSLIRQWQGSGMSQKDFCQKKDLPFSSFHYWYKKFRMSEAAQPELSFVPVPLPVSMTSIFCTVHKPGGVSIDFHQPVPVGLYVVKIKGRWFGCFDLPEICIHGSNINGQNEYNGCF